MESSSYNILIIKYLARTLISQQEVLSGRAQLWGWIDLGFNMSRGQALETEHMDLNPSLSSAG